VTVTPTFGRCTRAQPIAERWEVIATQEWGWERNAAGSQPRRETLFLDAACEVFREPANGTLGPGRSVRVDLLAESATSQRILSASVLVVGARTTDGRESHTLIARLRDRAPHLTIYVCASRISGAHTRLRELALAGVDELFVFDAPGDQARVEMFARQRLLAPVPAQILREATSVAKPGEGRTIALWCLRNGHRRRSSRSVAARFDRHPKSLNALCRRAGFSSASGLLRLSILYHHHELHRSTHLPAEEIARRLGFANATALAMHRMRARRARLVPHGTGTWPGVLDAPNR
jgi:hypothetical protein